MKLFNQLCCLLLASAFVVACQELPEENLCVLTFEDADYLGSNNFTGETDWTSLIDDPQYGGALLYGASGFGPTEYYWYDENNTNLKMIFPENWSTTSFSGGGHAISNYVDADLSHGDYLHQLSIPIPGHNGSKNFCIHNGYRDNTEYSAENLPALFFGDGIERVIDHMYVTNTTYALNIFINGNAFSPKVGENDWVKIIATGFNTAGEPTGTSEFFLANGSADILKEWKKWDLTTLGAVYKVEFNITGSCDQGYGFSQPAYFAYDDVAVRL